MFLWFPQALVGGCALSLLFTGTHQASGLLQRLPGHLSAAYLCVLTTLSRSTETFTIPPLTVGEAVAIQTVLWEQQRCAHLFARQYAWSRVAQSVFLRIKYFRWEAPDSLFSFSVALFDIISSSFKGTFQIIPVLAGTFSRESITIWYYNYHCRR